MINRSITAQHLPQDTLSITMKKSSFFHGSTFGNVVGATALYGQSPGDVPKAYLNFIFFDDIYENESFGFQQVSSAAEDDFQQLTLTYNATSSGYLYIVACPARCGGICNESNLNVDVYFDDMKITHTSNLTIVQADDYYPYGLSFNSYQRPAETPNKWKFQGQELQDDLGLNWYAFKWRNHQPDIGRFFNIDPLAEDYYYNSPYAFSENKVTGHVELEGLEAVLAISLGPDVKYRGDRLQNSVSDATHTNIGSDKQATPNIVNSLTTSTASDPKGIGFLSVFSHGVPGKIYGKGGYSKGMTTDDVQDIANAVQTGDISFSDGAIIYLGGCNAGTSWGSESLAQALADATGASVVAAENDQVGPKDESNGNMIYTTAQPSQNEFKVFEQGKEPTSYGSTVDVKKLAEYAQQRTADPLPELKPIKPTL